MAQSGLDDLFAKSFGDRSPFGDVARVDEVVRKLQTELPGLNAFVSVTPIGSAVSGTFVDDSSGLDLLMLLVGGPDEGPEGAISNIEQGLGLTVRHELPHGVAATHPEYGRICYIPGLIAPGSGVCIPDRGRGAWVKAFPRDHVRALRSLAEHSRCAIRVAKTWNAGREPRLEPFHVESIALEAFSGTSRPSGIHWAIKAFFDTARRSISEHHGHPLATGLVRFDYLSGSEEQHVIANIDRALGAANNAWFLVEMAARDEASKEAPENLKAATAWYAELLEPGFLNGSPER